MTKTSHQQPWISVLNACTKGSLLVLLLSVCPSVLQPLQAQTLTVVHNFKCPPESCSPQGDLYRDGAGNLYGTAAQGGNGEIFKITAAGTERILHKFTGGVDGAGPRAGLIRDSAGNFYGTAYGGGTSGDGVVFELTGSTLTVLHSFSGADGAHPTAALIRDSAGNLYGTTFYGGASCSCGTIFKIDSTGVESVLYSFTGGSDGKHPAGRLVRDAGGNLYGTASDGGIDNCFRGVATVGCGTVFKLDPTGVLMVLYSFGGGTDGGEPMAGLVRDGAGNLYGTTFSAGIATPHTNCALNYGCGVVFKVSHTGQETVLYSFTGNGDGFNPLGDLIRDSTGNLYGTTKLGGDGTLVGYGTVFEISSSGSESILHGFTGGSDGADPVAGLIRDSSGNLYGTATSGGSSTQGVVFRLTP